MSGPQRFTPLATILAVCALLFATVLPQTSRAIQLHWSSGATDTSFTANMRCMLVVQADSAEVTLPGAWRFQWIADSSGIQFVALDSLAACQTDTADVSSIDPPATPADSAANEITAHFCSAGSTSASRASFLLNLVGGSQGKIKVVALDPADSNSVLESNEVTYNGGVDGEYAPLVLRVSSVHQSLQLLVTAVGSGLSAANSLSIAASDGSWRLPLTIAARNDTALTGVASVAALLPACQASVGSQEGAVSAAMLPADQEPTEPLGQENGTICQIQYFEELLRPAPTGLGYTIQPKDFACAKGFVDQSSNKYALHLFYIRHNYWYYQPPGSPQLWHPELDEKNFGHSWTTALSAWSPTDTTGITVRSGRFDDFQVWAPTIVQLGPTFHMFYTGVQDQGGRHNQRIGVATSTDLNTWTQSADPVLTVEAIPWAKKVQSAYDGEQLRDPFVMADPVHGGQWLMYFVSVDSLTGTRMAVGVARSVDLVNWTADRDSLGFTQAPTFGSPTTSVESPHVFRHNGRWWLQYSAKNTVFFETTASADPTDTTTANWTSPIWLRGVTQSFPAQLAYWHATEYLRVGNVEYLAAFDDNASAIDIASMYAPDNPGVDSLKLWCPQVSGVTDPAARRNTLGLVVIRSRMDSPDVGFGLELPARTTVKLAVFDIAGRRRTTLLDRELPAGLTSLVWNGQDESGGRVASGVYFVRLSCENGTRVSKLIMLR